MLRLGEVLAKAGKDIVSLVPRTSAALEGLVGSNYTVTDHNLRPDTWAPEFHSGTADLDQEGHVAALRRMHELDRPLGDGHRPAWAAHDLASLEAVYDTIDETERMVHLEAAFAGPVLNRCVIPPQPPLLTAAATCVCAWRR